MVDKDGAAMARLELLSNTAMLKKVLDKTGKREGSTEKESSIRTRTEPSSKQSTPSTVSMPSPASSTAESNRRGESPSPPSIMDSSREAPPLLHERSGYAHHVHVPPQYYHYNRLDMEPARERRSHVEGAPYPGSGANPREYSSGSRRDMYCVDHHNAHGVGPQLPPYHQLPVGVRAPYPMKENVPPCHFASTGMYNDHHGMDVRHAGMPELMYYPPGVAANEDHEDSRKPSYETLAGANFHIRKELEEKGMIVSSLQQRVNYLETQISELRQLPTGKISHIPVDDMMRIMENYGSEVSNQTLPKRKENIKKASIVRQFRRWNPEFFRYFIHLNGEWVPKLGKDGEIKRRVEKRRLVKRNQIKES